MRNKSPPLKSGVHSSTEAGQSTFSPFIRCFFIQTMWKIKLTGFECIGMLKIYTNLIIWVLYYGLFLEL